MTSILLVDDDPNVRHAYASLLSSYGYDVTQAADGNEAVTLLRSNAYEAILSDVCMPGLSGLDFLRSVREYDLDVPVILISGSPDLESAMEAVEYGAFRYLTKPLEPKLLRDTILRAVRLHGVAKLKRQALQISGSFERWLGDKASLDARLEQALSTLWMAYQPIVSIKSRNVFGYEALMRCEEPTLRGPLAVLNAAERLNRIHDVGRAIRRSVSIDMPSSPGAAAIFLNVHPDELLDDDLFSKTAPLTSHASRIVLEITERTSLATISDIANRIRELRALGFRVAVDDLGSGYAGLTALAQLQPDVVKLDMSLVRDIEKEPAKQRVVQSMLSLCTELGMLVITEGVETQAEFEVLKGLGCDLLQGYFFAKPQQGFAMPNF